MRRSANAQNSVPRTLLVRYIGTKMGATHSGHEQKEMKWNEIWDVPTLLSPLYTSIIILWEAATAGWLVRPASEELAGERGMQFQTGTSLRSLARTDRQTENIAYGERELEKKQGTNERQKERKNGRKGGREGRWNAAWAVVGVSSWDTLNHHNLPPSAPSPRPTY